jgi:hypothetical protein
MAADKERGPGTASAEIGKYLDILAKDPKSRVFAPLAEAYRKAGHVDDALATALEGLKVHPNYLGGRVALGRAYFEKRQYAEAAAEMQKVVKSAPDNLMAHRVLGQIAQAQFDLPAAEKAFRMVLMLDPRDQEAQEFVAKVGGSAPASAERPPAGPAATTAYRPATPSPQAFEVLPLDEIQPLEELESQPGTPAEAPPPVSPVPELDLVERFAIESPPETPISEAPPVQEAPSLQAEAMPGEVPDAGLKLEVFTRVAWGEKHGGPPQAPVDDQKAFREISLQPEPPPPAPSEQPAEESPFEIFTREPAIRAVPPAAGTVRSEGAETREIEIETTGFLPPDALTEESGGTPVGSLEEELPRIDLTREVKIDFQDEYEAVPEAPPLPEPVIEPEPVFEPVSELEFEPAPEVAPEAPLPEPEPDIEPEPVSEFELEPAPEVVPEAPPPLPEPVIEPVPAFEPVPELEFEPAPEVVPEEPLPEPEPVIEPQPAFEPVPELEIESAPGPPPLQGAEEYEDVTGEEPPEAVPSGRGVFDTVTLAAIYVNQGFYGRAAEIYQRLVVKRPYDRELRRRLKEASDLERGKAGYKRAVTTITASPAEVRIGQLQTLLEAFRGGRPR